MMCAEPLTPYFLQGADYVEFDVHLSKDKQPVVYHDFAVALTLRKVRRMQSVLKNVYFSCVIHRYHIVCIIFSDNFSIL